MAKAVFAQKAFVNDVNRATTRYANTEEEYKEVEVIQNSNER
jgi:hypothetical protein